MANFKKSRRQVALPIDGRSDLLSAEIRGGKGTSLAVMQQLGLRVPPAFTVSTTVMRAYRETKLLPKRLEHQLKREVTALEKKTGKKFGDPSNPLLLAVRSGAATSMPGMMDTILNLGINKEVMTGFEQRSEQGFGKQLLSRFVTGWQEIANQNTQTPPDDVWEQLIHSIISVINSWDNERARTYRKHCGIDHKLGTAVNIQAMVYGNKDTSSGTGVVFSHNVNTGNRGLYGEFLPCAQGEDVVSGTKTPHSIEFLKEWNQPLYKELEAALKLLENHEHSMVEVEFTIESGVLYFLQHRKAKASLEARITSIVHDIWEKRIDHEVGLSLISTEELAQISNTGCFAETEIQAAISQQLVTEGIPASPGVASGNVVFTSEEAVRRSEQGEKVILFRPDTNPNDLPGMLVAAGIVTQNGGATCHAAVTARALGIPAVVGVNIPQNFPTNQLSLDGSRGLVVSGLLSIQKTVLKKEVSLFSKWQQTEFPRPRYNPDWVDKRTLIHNQLINVYLMELMAHEAKGTKLAHEAKKLMSKWYTDTAELFLCYLSYAVTSELRHTGINSMGGKEQLESFLSARASQGISLKKYTKTDLLDFFNLAIRLFRGYEWDSLYGGERWAVIAETVAWFLTGKIGHQIFVDRVFDLQHNTGHVFDKHEMVKADRYSLNDLLEDKKHASSVRELVAKWKKRESYYPASFAFNLAVDNQVLSLYSTGLNLNVWR